MDDFSLKVFVSAARNLSFTKCAQEMFISQPAVSKRISELERTFGLPLFERRGSSLILTPAGETLLQHARGLLEGYNALQYEMSLLKDELSGELHVGASTTIAQYLLPPVLARFVERYPEVKVIVTSGNSRQVEAGLLDHSIDVGLVENASREPGLHYDDLLRDELVLVADAHSRYARVDEMSIRELQQLPIVLRENGSGTLQVIEKAFAKQGYSLDSFRVVMQLGSTEAIKLFIRNGDALAIVSVISVSEELKENRLHVIDLTDTDLTRRFAFVARVNDNNKLSERFCQFVRRGVNHLGSSITKGYEV